MGMTLDAFCHIKDLKLMMERTSLRERERGSLASDKGLNVMIQTTDWRQWTVKANNVWTIRKQEGKE